MTMKLQNGLPAVTCRDLRALQDKAEPHVIIDVRSLADYEAGHVEGSVHVPAEELETNIDALVPKKDEYVIVVGEEKGLAEAAHERLKARGYSRVEFLLGGFDEWCKPAEPDISDLKEDAEMEKEIAEPRGEHGEDVDDVEQGTQDQPLF